jgi:signal transduction histidine kinase
MLRVLIILFFSAVFLLSETAPASADSREMKRVLVLYSLEKGNVGQERIAAQLKDIFSRNKNYNIQIFSEYLDLIRFPEEAQISRLAHFLNSKYSGEKIDAVITILPPALECLKSNGTAMFKGAPVIAAMLPRDAVESLAASPLRKRATGIIYADNAYEIAQSALMLRPGTKHIAFVAGTSHIDISFKVPIMREIKRAAEGRELIDLSGLTMRETLSRVHTLPPDTIVFHTSIFRDKAGEFFHPPDVHRLVSQASNAPVFGLVESHMGKGIVGGRLALLEWHTGKIAELTLHILSGVSPAAIPIVEEGGYRSVYDWRELKRWGIPENSLPKGSILINKETSLLDRYKKYFVAGMLFFIFQTALIFVLIKLNRQKRRAYAQLQDYTGRYYELLRVDRSSRLGELTASLAHELNQPLAAILSNAQAALRFLASGKNDPELSREILQNIVQDDKRAADVIRSLRSMVKKGETRKENVNINDLLQEVIAITQGSLVSHDIRIETVLDDALPSVIADRTQIQQVALNLIMNAIDAVALAAPEQRRIALKTELADGFARVGVRDYGAGIPPEMVEKIFDPFYTTKTNGLGMGLAVCRSIITDHGGRIWVENNSGGGTIFYFVLKVTAHD